MPISKNYIQNQSLTTKTKTITCIQLCHCPRFWCIVIGNKVVLLGIMLAFSARLNVNLHVFGNKNGPVNKAYINQNEVAQRQL